MTKETFDSLVKCLETSLLRHNSNCRSAISPEEKVAICLKFLATGDSYKSIALSYRVGETTVRRAVNDTCDAI